ncbi:MAG: DNA-directed RNA polymerase subunit P [Candidatus Pacearchaeota archaeon]
MPIYKCYFCGKQVSSKSLEKVFICPSCGGRIFFKKRAKVKKIKAI